MGARRRTAASGLVISLAAHGLVLTALVAGLRIYQPPTPTPPIELQLLPWPVQRPPLKPVARRAAPQAASRPAPPVAAPLAPAIPAGPSAPPMQTPSPSPSVADAEQLRGALRGLLGCERPALLTDRERLACDQRASRSASALSAVNPDNRARYATSQNQDPILARKPHNGCAPRVGDQDIGMTTQGGSIASGIACAWSFW